MEITMKKTGLFLALALLSAALQAQEIPYALPATSVTVKVDVRQESFFAGPYAAYAKRMLNMSVEDRDRISAEITRVELIPCVEADTGAWYTCDAESAALMALGAQGLVSLGGSDEQNRWNFQPSLRSDYSDKGLTEPRKQVVQIVYEQIQTDTALVSVPVEQKVMVDKTLEDKAQEAAEKILNIRQARLDIAMGDTDANYSGEAMQAALDEMKRTEEDYMALFRGYSVVRKQSYVFEVLPSAGVTNHRYLVFRLTDEGPVAEGTKGTPYYLELHPEGTLPEEQSQRKSGKGAVRYRIPQVCRVTFSRDGQPMLQTRIPFYQLGRESVLILSK